MKSNLCLVHLDQIRLNYSSNIDSTLSICDENFIVIMSEAGRKWKHQIETAENLKEWASPAKALRYRGFLQPTEAHKKGSPRLYGQILMRMK